MISNRISPLTPVSGLQQPPIFHRTLAIKAERFAGHNEAKKAIVLSLAGVTAIMLIENLFLMILY